MNDDCLLAIMRTMLQERRDQDRMHHKTPEAGIYSLLWIKFYTTDTRQLSLNHETAPRWQRGLFTPL